MSEHYDAVPRSAPTQPWTEEHEKLYNEAMTRFRARCLWSANPSRSSHGLAIIADRLRSHGGMEAWKLAEKIRKAVGNAAG